MPENFVEFFPKHHIYTYDGIRIPSVTEIIRFANAETDYSAVPEWILKRAGEIGDLTHAIIHRYYAEHGNLITDDKSVRAYLEAFYHFLTNNNFKCKFTELQLFCSCHFIAGTVDLVGFLNGEPYILDIKTTNKINKEYVELQTAAYHHLFETFFENFFSETIFDEKNEAPLFKRGIIHLKKSGVSSVDECTDTDSWPTFESFVQRYWEEKGEMPNVR